MKVLAIDTSMVSCGVAVVDDQDLVAEYTCNNGKTHSVNIMSMVEGLLDQCKLSFEDFYGFGVTSGPGTFTGLRIGISAVKGMACAINKPVLGVNSLDALAFPLKNTNRPIVPVIDAKRGEVYYACYHFNTGKLVGEVSYKLDFPEKVALDIPADAILIGSGVTTYLDIFRKKFDIANVQKEGIYNIIRASSIAFIAVKKFTTENVDEIYSLIPRYMRKADVRIKK